MAEDHKSWKETAEAVPELRFLKTLVTGLTLVMGLGIIAVVALLWVRLGQPVLPELPASVTLPEGAVPEALSFGPNWLVVVTTDGQVLLYDRAGQFQGSVTPQLP